jgi:hypothetical protein
MMGRYSDPPSFMNVLQVVLVLLAIPLVLLRGGCVDKEVAIHAATVEGYTDVKVTDRHDFLAAWHGCSGSDAVGFEVSATNVKGDRVKLLVCSGWLIKAATVRIP